MMISSDSHKRRERRLLKLLAALRREDQETLVAFAEFLASRRKAQGPTELPEPEPMPRPADESVVAAIRRLSATYPMLDKSRMLNETSSLMTQHIMQGRAAAEVIDDLEAVFSKHYERFKQEFGEE